MPLLNLIVPISKENNLSLSELRKKESVKSVPKKRNRQKREKTPNKEKYNFLKFKSLKKLLVFRIYN